MRVAGEESGDSHAGAAVPPELAVSLPLRGATHQAVPPALRPDLLPEGGPGAGEPGHQHGVEAAHVDPELERVGRRQPQQLARAQPLLDLAPLLGEVAAAVGRHGRGRRGNKVKANS